MTIKKQMLTMNKGLITKSQKEIYYVLVNNTIYMCKARGNFREKNIKPLVGDKVIVQILENNTGYITEILDRKNEIIRPPIANIDQVLLVHSLTSPKINYRIFDKYLVMLEHFNIPVVLIINKIDLSNEADVENFEKIYDKTKYKYIFTSVKENIGIDKLKSLLKDKVSTFAGPSGVGKSSILNLLHDDIDSKTGNISEKTLRGRHTTRHIELFEIDANSFIFDTPGFSSLDLSFIEDENEIKYYFPEFNENNKCKFNDCNHINEPGCEIKKLLGEDKISKLRYENYLYMFNQKKDERKY